MLRLGFFTGDASSSEEEEEPQQPGADPRSNIDPSIHPSIVYNSMQLWFHLAQHSLHTLSI